MAYPDELFYLKSQGEAELTFDASLYPRYQTALVRRKLSLKVSGEPATAAGLTLRIVSSAHGAELRVTTDAHGELAGLQPTDPLGPLAGEPVFDTWTIRITAEDNPGPRRRQRAGLARPERHHGLPAIRLHVPLMAKNDAQTPTASPPGGIGAVPGLGEAFQVNLNTGQGVYSYKLTLPAGVAGHTPSLGTGVPARQSGGRARPGLAACPVRSIDRRLDLGSDGDDSSATESYRDGSTLLVALQDGTYGAESESSFNRYRRAGDGWTIEERTGMVHTLGTAPDSRVADPDHPERVVQWLIERSTDPVRQRRSPTRGT